METGESYVAVSMLLQRFYVPLVLPFYDGQLSLSTVHVLEALMY